MTSDSDTSTTPNARNSHNRSVSADTRVIRLPVRLREKNERLSRWMCSYSSARRSRATHSPRTAISRRRATAAAWRTTYTSAIAATASQAIAPARPTASRPSWAGRTTRSIR